MATPTTARLDGVADLVVCRLLGQFSERVGCLGLPLGGGGVDEDDV
jgi:hypothetical protein